MKVIMDFDDFCDRENELSSLLKLRRKNGPNFKVTLFTIPGKSSLAYLQHIKHDFPWIELAIHGWSHDGVGECLNWDRVTARKYLRKALAMQVFVPGFKPPHWLANTETYLACRDLGIWVMEIKTHRRLLPDGLVSYILEEPKYEGIIQIHGHISNYPPNYIKTHLSDFVFGPKFDYDFIDHYLQSDNRLK